MTRAAIAALIHAIRTRDAATAEAAIRALLPQWVPVAERLPESLAPVIGFWPESIIPLVCVWTGDNWENPDNGDTIRAPSHWQPLPLPPPPEAVPEPVSEPVIDWAKVFCVIKSPQISFKVGSGLF